MKQIKTTLLRKAILLSASFLLLLSACKKDGNLNPDFSDDSSASFFTDSVIVTSKTVLSDSITSDKVAIGLVGSYNDSIFGTSKASLSIQPLLSSNFLVFGGTGDQTVTDSVVLSLEYADRFGDSIQQTFEVYRIDEELDNETDYYSNHQTSVIPAAIGSKSFESDLVSKVKILQPNISGTIDTVELNPHLRIKLDNSIGDEILSKSGQSELENSSNFAAFFKGLQITPTANPNINPFENSILSFALSASNSKMTVYYTNYKANGDTVKNAVEFPINSASVRYNTFEHDLTASETQNNLSTNSVDSLYSYLIGMAGVQVEIDFPSIKQQFDPSSIIINKAELELPVSTSTYSKFGLADRLLLASKSEDGSLDFIDDFFVGNSYFGGGLNDDDFTYKFNISRYIHSLINSDEQENKKLILLVSGSAVKADRAVIYGYKNSTRKIKLNLYYSKSQ